MFEVPRNPRGVHLAEGRQNLVDLRPLQIDQHALPDPGFLNHFASCSCIRGFAPLHTPGNRLPKPGRPAPLEQQKFSALRVDHDQDGFGPAKLLQGHSILGGVRTRMCSSLSCVSLTSVGSSINRSAAVWVLGNAITSRILSAPAINIANRSRPKAIPPCGGAPYLSASSKNPNFTRASSADIPNKSKTTDCSSWLWRRTDPPPISEPFNTMS